MYIIFIKKVYSVSRWFYLIQLLEYVEEVTKITFFCHDLMILFINIGRDHDLFYINKNKMSKCIF